MSEYGLHFLLVTIFTACLYLSVAGPMRNQAESAGQELMSIFLLPFGSGSTSNAQKAFEELGKLYFKNVIGSQVLFSDSEQVDCMSACYSDG